MQMHDQGLVNTDERFIYVPFHGINLIPTDIRGLTYNRSPQMNLNILTVGAKDGKGGFFPEGIHGKINTPEVRIQRLLVSACQPHTARVPSLVKSAVIQASW